jgi:glucose/mannose-6-phosphate isomerase
LRKAIAISKEAKLSLHQLPINNVFISGLGGSGIGGSIVSELVQEVAHCPIQINKDYFIPAYINENTLAIICTYSGNTEETIQVLKLCIERKAKITIITSGGEALQLAEAHGLDHIVLPGGFPPRSCIGYSITQIFKTLVFQGICKVSFESELENAALLLETEQNNIRKAALSYAQLLIGKLPIIYTLGATEGVAIRFRQQINENSKMLCWHHVLPEMNHNELVAWTEKNENLAVIIFRYENDYYRTVKRLEVCKEVFKKYTNTIFEIHAVGATPIERAMYMIHIGDWISCEIADIKKVDAVDISIITHLKDELSKIN